ncbi:MAG: copper-binding protein [Rhodoferax sp.]|uniref:copper-binding protein n=1 Tax=Rhodoferax sp. TaxID=50421 RepID=UPI0017A2202B|nr:copper-binding protein [Rhodoferax sp.]NMM15112.1 copper-binding protein [Rhodoferax sp.]NMM21875.1 copper-binding protein [Rhodoferax sp.]
MKYITALTLLGGLVAGGHALAQGTTNEHEAHHPAATASATATATDMTDAEVRKVDLETQKITLKHGEIKNLGMPPMTMVFRVKDPALLTAVKAGDKVKFSADRVNGVFTVLTLEPVK